jgi:phospholipid/cholesterol/gamma-HCH transport system substrate-binding protein
VKQRSIIIRLIIFALLALTCGALEVGTLTGPHVGTTYTYHAIFSAAQTQYDGVSGLREGNPVSAAGVAVGKVTSVKLLNATNAEVTFTANDDQQLTTTTDAVVRYANLLGQRYLALTQGSTNPGTPLRHGATISASHTEPALSLTALFNGFRPLFSVISPAQVDELSNDIIAVLQGQTDRLDDLVAKTADLTTNLADRDETFKTVLDGLATLLSTVAQHDDELASAVVSLHTLTAELQADGPALLDSVSSIDGLTGSIGNLLGSLEDHGLPRDISDLDSITAPVAQNTGTLNNLVGGFVQAFGDFSRVSQNGNWVNIYPCNVNVVTYGTVQVTGADAVTALSDALGGGLASLLNSVGLSVSSLATLAIPVPLTLPNGTVGSSSAHTKVCS